MERPCPGTAFGWSSEEIEQAPVVCSGEERSHDDDTDHAQEHDTDVDPQRQSECVRQPSPRRGCPPTIPSPSSPTPPTKPA
jgi:hypothetical protein